VSPSHGAPRYLFVKEGARFFRCPRCGTYLNDSDYSSEAYEAAGPREGSGETGESILARRSLRWGTILADIERVAPPPATLLDVGTGSGGFVRLALDMGYDASGVTMAERDVAFARREFGIELARGTLDGFPGSGYDIVCATSVIEHVPDAAGFLRGMGERVRPGGHVAVTTPSADSYQRFMLGARRWRMIRPEHLSLFSPRGLRELVVLGGLEPVRHVTSSTAMQGLRRLGPLAPPVRAALFRALRLAGLGGDQTLVARKPM
jgi:SAM-dependent methyltransferase